MRLHRHYIIVSIYNINRSPNLFLFSPFLSFLCWPHLLVHCSWSAFSDAAVLPSNRCHVYLFLFLHLIAMFTTYLFHVCPHFLCRSFAASSVGMFNAIELDDLESLLMPSMEHEENSSRIATGHRGTILLPSFFPSFLLSFFPSIPRS
jgi:hypothetical protein